MAKFQEDDGDNLEMVAEGVRLKDVRDILYANVISLIRNTSKE